MGRTAIIIAVSYVVATVVVTLIGIAVAASTRRRREVDTARIAETEKAWFVISIVILTALLFATIFFTPYGRSASADAQRVQIKGVQFAWIVSGGTVHAGRQVEFSLTSGDVNHELGVYTEHWKLLFQVQVMPEKTQKYVYTFDRPGTYRLVCLEFCGLNHDVMQSQLRVVP